MFAWKAQLGDYFLPYAAQALKSILLEGLYSQANSCTINIVSKLQVELKYMVKVTLRYTLLRFCYEN